MPITFCIIGLIVILLYCVGRIPMSKIIVPLLYREMTSIVLFITILLAIVAVILNSTDGLP